MTQSNKFLRTMNNPEKGIGVTISEKDKEKFEENREILTCIIKCLEVSGWLGIALKDHREDNSVSSFNNGNFKELLEFRANSRDNTFRKHLDAGKRNAMYTSKTTQNDFLEYIKEFIQRKIYDEVASQPYGQLFGIQIDEITDSTNIEQLGIILQYVFEGKPRERLFKCIDCDRTTGEELCNSIFKVFEKCPSNIKNCWFQTIDGEAKMSGRNKECAVLLQEKGPPQFTTTVSIMISV